MSVRDKLVTCAMAALNIDDESLLTDEAVLSDTFGADSLDSMELIMCIEEELDISIKLDSIRSNMSFGQIVQLVEEQVGAAA